MSIEEAFLCSNWTSNRKCPDVAPDLESLASLYFVNTTWHNLIKSPFYLRLYASRLYAKTVYSRMLTPQTFSNLVEDYSRYHFTKYSIRWRSALWCYGQATIAGRAELIEKYYSILHSPNEEISVNDIYAAWRGYHNLQLKSISNNSKSYDLTQYLNEHIETIPNDLGFIEDCICVEIGKMSCSRIPKCIDAFNNTQIANMLIGALLSGNECNVELYVNKLLDYDDSSTYYILSAAAILINHGHSNLAERFRARLNLELNSETIQAAIFYSCLRCGNPKLARECKRKIAPHPHVVASAIYSMNPECVKYSLRYDIKKKPSHLDQFPFFSDVRYETGSRELRSLFGFNAPGLVTHDILMQIKQMLIDHYDEVCFEFFINQIICYHDDARVMPTYYENFNVNLDKLYAEAIKHSAIGIFAWCIDQMIIEHGTENAITRCFDLSICKWIDNEFRNILRVKLGIDLD